MFDRERKHVIGVFDIDSGTLAYFNEIDAKYLN